MSKIGREESPILLIDGDKGRSHSLAMRLRLNGHKTELCSSGFQAIQLLESFGKEEKYALMIIVGDPDDMPGREILLLARGVVKKAALPILFCVPDGVSEKESLTFVDEGADLCVPRRAFGDLLEKIDLLKKK